jgi:hypothetical protein
MKDHNPHKKRDEFVLQFVFPKESPFVIVTRWCLEVIGCNKIQEHCEDHCPSIKEGHHQCPKDAGNQVF